MTKVIAPANWRDNARWYDWFSYETRAAYAKEHCSKTYIYHGQTVVIISYPRYNGNVAFYDMDGGRILWAPLKDCVVGKLFEEEGRAAEEQDFQWSAILGSLLADEATDICYRLFE
jgi:hypothetical protein